MAKPKLSRVVVFGVDVGGALPGPAAASTDVASARQLANLLQRYQIPATWAVTQFNSTIVRTVHDGSPQHEIALLWNEHATRRSADAFQLAGRLRDRVTEAADCGLILQSIAADPRGMLPYHSLSRYGFRSLRTTRTCGTQAAGTIQPQSLRHGLWGVPVSCFWPHASRFMQVFSLRTLMYQTRVVAQGHDALHVVIDLPMLQSSGTGCWQQLERLLQQTQQLRTECGLRTCRLADIDVMVRADIAAQPARSILRRTA